MDTQLKIKQKEITHNANVITEYLSDYDKFIAVLKGCAYGHGEQIVQALENTKITMVAVSGIDEALNVRKYSKNIGVLILEPIEIQALNVAEENNFSITVHTTEYLKDLIAAEKKLRIHIKLDTGLNRLGFVDKKEVKTAIQLAENSNLIVEGIYSHFQTVGIYDNIYDLQVAKFIELTEGVDLKKIPYVHFSNSTVLLCHQKLDFCNTARFGIMLYGFNVCPSYGDSFKDRLRLLRNRYYQRSLHLSKTTCNVKLDLHFAMEMTTRILQIKEVEGGTFVGYGNKHRVNEKIRVAVLAAGYNNGIKNQRYVYINNKKCEVVGPIFMNMMCVKIDDSVTLNDTVVLVGQNLTIGKLASMRNESISQVLLSIGKNNIKVYE